MGMLIDRTMGISIVCRDELKAKDEDRGIGMGEGEGKSKWLGDGMELGIQRMANSVDRSWEVQPGVATLEDRVAGDKGQEERVEVEVKEGELMLCDKCFCEWEEGTEGRRQRGGVSYTPRGQT